MIDHAEAERSMDHVAEARLVFLYKTQVSQSILYIRGFLKTLDVRA